MGHLNDHLWGPCETEVNQKWVGSEMRGIYVQAQGACALRFFLQRPPWRTLEKYSQNISASVGLPLPLPLPQLRLSSWSLKLLCTAMFKLLPPWYKL